jgi:hypothetical protein
MYRDTGKCIRARPNLNYQPLQVNIVSGSRSVQAISSKNHQLQRHGARYPTSGSSKAIRASLRKLQNASEYHDVGLEFLRSYQWHLGEADLVPFGAIQ